MYKDKIIQTIVFIGAVLSIIAIFLPIYEMSYSALSIVDAESIYDDYRSRGNELLALIFMLAPASATLAIILKKKEDSSNHIRSDSMHTLGNCWLN